MSLRAVLYISICSTIKMEKACRVLSLISSCKIQRAVTFLPPGLVYSYLLFFFSFTYTEDCVGKCLVVCFGFVVGCLIVGWLVCFLSCCFGLCGVFVCSFVFGALLVCGFFFSPITRMFICLSTSHSAIRIMYLFPPYPLLPKRSL